MKIATHMPLSLLEPVSAAFPGVEIVSIPVDGDVPEDLEAEILLTLPWGAPNLAAVLEKGIRWVHAYGTGVNGFPFELLGDRILTCSRGASATAISEWVMAVLVIPETI